MNSIMLTPEHHACWVAAVAEWPTCQTCNGDGRTRCNHDGCVNLVCVTCPDCVAGRVPQPVVLVIEGEPHHDALVCGFAVVEPHECKAFGRVPVGWRVPAGEPAELRATCERCHGDGEVAATDQDQDTAEVVSYPVICYSCGGKGSVLVARATVELLPVVDITGDRTDRVAPVNLLDFDPKPVPGRHWVAICTPEPAT